MSFDTRNNWWQKKWLPEKCDLRKNKLPNCKKNLQNKKATKKLTDRNMIFENKQKKEF